MRWVTGDAVGKKSGSGRFLGLCPGRKDGSMGDVTLCTLGYITVFRVVTGDTVELGMTGDIGLDILVQLLMTHIAPLGQGEAGRYLKWGMGLAVA